MAPLPRHFSQRPLKSLHFKATQPDPVETDVTEIKTEVEIKSGAIDIAALLDGMEDDTPTETPPAKTVETPAKPAWSMVMKRPDLLSLAVGKGITVPEEATKAQIIALLDASVAT